MPWRRVHVLPTAARFALGVIQREEVLIITVAAYRGGTFASEMTYTRQYRQV